MRFPKENESTMHVRVQYVAYGSDDPAVKAESDRLLAAAGRAIAWYTADISKVGKFGDPYVANLRDESGRVCGIVAINE